MLHARHSHLTPTRQRFEASQARPCCQPRRRPLGPESRLVRRHLRGPPTRRRCLRRMADHGVRRHPAEVCDLCLPVLQRRHFLSLEVGWGRGRLRRLRRPRPDGLWRPRPDGLRRRCASSSRRQQWPARFLGRSHERLRAGHARRGINHARCNLSARGVCRCAQRCRIRAPVPIPGWLQRRLRLRCQCRCLRRRTRLLRRRLRKRHPCGAGRHGRRGVLRHLGVNPRPMAARLDPGRRRFARAQRWIRLRFRLRFRRRCPLGLIRTRGRSPFGLG